MMYSSFKRRAFSVACFQQCIVASMIYSSFEAKMMLPIFQVYVIFLPNKFGIFKYQMQADVGGNVTESLSRIIGEAEERRFGGG